MYRRGAVGLRGSLTLSKHIGACEYDKQNVEKQEPLQ